MSDLTPDHTTGTSTNGVPAAETTKNAKNAVVESEVGFPKASARRIVPD
jgi:hypothetical protein